MMPVVVLTYYRASDPAFDTDIRAMRGHAALQLDTVRTRDHAGVSQDKKLRLAPRTPAAHTTTAMPGG